MSHFVFRNQRFLDHLGRIEDNKKNDLSRVMGKVNQERASIESSRVNRGKVLAAVESGLLHPDQTSLRCLLFKSYDESASTARHSIRMLQGELEQARSAYIQARQKRQAIERLKEKRHKEFMKKEQDSERKALDDQAGQRYIRARTDGEKGGRHA